jgi:isopenicillin N synthase-like dioxygenase
MMIPRIDVTSLFDGPTPARMATDRALLGAAADAGFLTIAAAPGLLPCGATERAALLRIFTLTDAQRAPLLRHSFAPGNRNLYRGFFPLQDNVGSYKEGIDLGPDIADPARADPEAADPLLEPTPLPTPTALPGWHDAAAAAFRALERVGGVLMRGLARALDLPEATFDAAFADGISTLRLIHYPPRPAASYAALPEDAVWAEHDGVRRHVIGGAHVDSGFVTLLAQDGVPGLQAQGADGAWHDVPPAEGTLAVNFGLLLERWTGGRIRATRHRVLGTGRSRHSIPFFYEPRVDAVIRPLPLRDGPGFAPFSYGDHLWAAMLRFPEFRGLADARAPRGVRAA